LPESDAAGASLSTQRLLHALTAPILLGEDIIRMSASVGMALYPEQGEDGETLLQQADAAMYRCKRERGQGSPLPAEMSAP
jgi:GGDEF domain-containing protein